MFKERRKMGKQVQIILVKLVFSFLPFSLLFAQQESGRVSDPSNMREGEKIEYCVTHKNMMEARNNVQLQHFFSQTEVPHKKGTNPSGTEKGTIYTIPVVFHVIHNNGIENISTNQLMDALRVLNEGFRAQNADITNVQPPFQGMQADAEIEFKLATIAPDGTCFNGITRTVSAISYQPVSSQELVEAVIAGNDIYQGVWPHTNYLNIVVTANLGGAAGYTWYPFTDNVTNSVNMGFNSIYMLHNYTGSIGTSNLTKSTSLIHEVGHWLNLPHPWGDSNNPGDPENCNIDDGVQDTPLCKGVTSCNLNANTCDDLNDPNSFSSWLTDVVDNVENYMDYSYCSRMFTPGQVTRMRTAIVNTVAGRNLICSSENLQLVGVTTTPVLCNADFTIEKPIACAGDSVHFTDASYHYVNSWNWTFEGANETTSVLQNPTVVWNTPGIYSVMLVVSDGIINDTAHGTVTIVDVTGSLAYIESFEDISTFAGSAEWFITNPSGNGWEVTSTAASTGSRSAKINNFGQSTGQLDQLYASGVDLSDADASIGITFSFRYAYRKCINSNNDALKVYFSNDCGQTWNLRKTLTATAMSGSSTVSTDWFPELPDWEICHVNNLTDEYWTPNFRYRFEFKSGGGNNVFIDDINIYSGPPSDVVVGLGLIPMQRVHIYPNPANNQLHAVIMSGINENAEILLTDLQGKILLSQQHFLEKATNHITLETNNYAKGNYILEIRTFSGSVLRSPVVIE